MGDINALNALTPANQGLSAVRSGAWSDSATWGGAPPSGGAVAIPKGVGVILDAQLNANFTSVRVDGCLEFARSKNTRLRTDLLFVAPGGELWVGSPGAPITANVAADIIFPATGSIDVAKDPRLLGKGLVSASKASFYGAQKTSRMRTTTAPLAGATVLALESAPQGWRVGDRLVLTGTHWVKFKNVNGVKRAENPEDEELTVQAVNGASVTVSPALKFSHDTPGAGMQPYLVNFSRNIRLTTENGASLGPSQRAHAMFMSPQTQIRSVEFNEMGRTDKSVRAVDVTKVSPVTATTNAKGRYPLHLHQTNMGSNGTITEIRNVAVWKSPGWGIAQHSSQAFLYDNAVYDAFGASFAAEAGDEEGAWVGNTAIRSEGVNELVKDDASVQAFDLGRTGDGYWLQGRLLHLSKNVAASMGGGKGFVYMHRGAGTANPTPITGEMILQPASMRYVEQTIDHPSIQQFADNEVFASDTGFHVVKSNPRQPHDARTVIDGFKAWEVGVGVELTYVSHYTIKDSLIVGAADGSSTIGVDFGKNTYDTSVANSQISNFNVGVNFAHDWTETFAPAAFYVAAGNILSNIRIQNYQNADVSDLILPNLPVPVAANVAFAWGSALPFWNSTNGFRNFSISGIKTDSAGAVLYPTASGDFDINIQEIRGVLEAEGYHTLSTGEHVISIPEFSTDRVTGAIELQSFLVEIDPAFDVSTYQNQGSLNPAAAAPAAKNDSYIVQRNSTNSLDVKANDSSPDSQLRLTGMTTARHGYASLLPDGRIGYAPYPDFTGTDSFSYWIRSGAGRPSKASVTVTVQ